MYKSLLVFFLLVCPFSFLGQNLVRDNSFGTLGVAAKSIGGRDFGYQGFIDSLGYIYASGIYQRGGVNRILTLPNLILPVNK